MVVARKKKIAFYSVLCSGHLNVCKSIASALLDKHSDRVEIYFIVDDLWAEKLRNHDSRFKFCIFEYDKKEQNDRIEDMVTNMEPVLSAPLVERMIFSWINFLDWNILPEIDRKSQEMIEKIDADFLICDQVCHLPAMQCRPYAFINSCSPNIHGLDFVPQMGDDSRVDEIEKMRKFKEDFSEFREKMNKRLSDFFIERGTKYENRKYKIDQPISDHFSVYCYPADTDYYNDEIRKQHNLWQIDSSLLPSKVPKPFVLPEEFAKLPGEIVYVSLGSLFSAYYDKLQKLIDILNKFPYKYIVSKGPNGDKINFPSNKFIGGNFVDQLAVLQVCDLMIAHGGNNTFCECFYFGVPQIIMPAVVDQINNSTRVEETGFGYKLNLLTYTEDELKDRIDKILNDKELKQRLKDASRRIQKDNKIYTVASQIMNYIEKL